MPSTRRVLKWAKHIFIGCLLVILSLLSFVQIGQWVARRRAERLLSDIQSLRLQRSTWSDAQRIINLWGRWGHYKGTCDASNCEYGISIKDWATDVALGLYRFPRLERLAEPVLFKLTPLIGARLPEVDSQVSVHDGKVVGIYFSVDTVVPYMYGVLMSSTISTAHPEYYVEWPERNPHPEYSMVMRHGTLHLFFTEFNADAKDEDLEWLMEFNLSCMTRLSPCKEDSDLRPSAWRHYIAENKNRALIQEKIDKCDLPVQQLVEAAENIALVRATFTSSSDPEKPTLTGELVENLKGTSSWQVGGIRDVFSIDGDRYGDHRTPVQIVLFPEDENRIYAHACGIIPATPQNLRIVRETLRETAVIPSR
jgi:hypothetical protein